MESERIRPMRQRIELRLDIRNKPQLLRVNWRNQRNQDESCGTENAANKARDHGHAGLLLL